MNVTKLNYAQFKVEKQKILSLVREWQRTDEEFFDQNYSIVCNSDLRYHWKESVIDMITFLEKNIPEEEEPNFEKGRFSFFIAEDEEGIQGIALGIGPCTLQGYSVTLFGISGTFFEIKDMLIARAAMHSRCYSIKDKVPHKSIGKELLKALVNHVNTLDKPYPILARPHHNNRIAHDFFENHLFRLECGSIGHSYILKVADFVRVPKAHKEHLGNKRVLIIEDYEVPSIVRM
jgi:hypothetical protein